MGSVCKPLWQYVIRSVRAAIHFSLISATCIGAYLRPGISDVRSSVWCKVNIASVARGLYSDNRFTATLCSRSVNPACSGGAWPFVGLSPAGILFGQRHGVRRCSDARCLQLRLPSMTRCAKPPQRSHSTIMLRSSCMRQSQFPAPLTPSCPPSVPKPSAVDHCNAYSRCYGIICLCCSNLRMPMPSQGASHRHRQSGASLPDAWPGGADSGGRAGEPGLARRARLCAPA